MRTLAICLLLACAGMAWAAALTIKVVDSDGEPVAAAYAVCYSGRFDLAENELAVRRTDEDGICAFAIDDPPARPEASASADVMVYMPGFALAGARVEPDKVTTVSLARGGQAWGTVVDGEGRPVPGVVVTLQEVETPCAGYADGLLHFPAPYRHSRMSVRTTADGRWALGDVPLAGWATVRVEDPRYLAASSTFPLGADVLAPPIVLRRGGTLRGRVVNEDGKPLEAVRINMSLTYANGGNTSQHHVAETDDRGVFCLAPLPAGVCQIGVEDPMGLYIAPAQAQLKVEEGQETVVPDIVATKGAIIHGTVIDTATGKPLENVSILCNLRAANGDSLAYVSASTNKDGYYRLRVLPGTQVLRASDARSEPDVAHLPVESTIAIKAGEVHTANLRITPLPPLAGAVIDTDGHPVPGAEITLAGQTANISVTTDGQGRFAHCGVPPTTCHAHITGRWQLNGWVLDRPTQVVIPSKDPISIVLRRVPVQTLTGRVVSPDGTPLAGVTVALDTQTDENIVLRELVTGPTGAFSLAGLHPGVSVVFARAERRDCQYVSGGKVTCVDGVFHIEDIVMAPLSGTVTGTVVDAAGAPVAGALIGTPQGGIGPFVTTDARGHFALDHLPVGEVTIMAALGTTFGTAKTNTDAAPVTITLVPAPPQPPRDQARGLDILEHSLQEDSGSGVARLLIDLVRYDPAAALRIAERNARVIGETDWVILVAAIAQADPAHAMALTVPLRAHITTEARQGQALAALGLAIVAAQPAEAVRLYDQAKQLIAASIAPRERIDSYTRLAELVALLRNGDAAAMADQAITIALQSGAPSLVADITAAIAEVDPDLAETLAGRDPEDKAKRPSALARLIAVLAQRDLPRAQRLLAQERLGDHRSRSYTLAARAVATALAPRDSAAALRLAHTIPGLQLAWGARKCCWVVSGLVRCSGRDRG